MHNNKTRTPTLVKVTSTHWQ